MGSAVCRRTGWLSYFPQAQIIGTGESKMGRKERKRGIWELIRVKSKGRKKERKIKKRKKEREGGRKEEDQSESY